MAIPGSAYSIADKLPIVSTPDVKVTLMTYAPGQEVPWHTHSTITDSTFCLEGQVELCLGPPGLAACAPDAPHSPQGRRHPSASSTATPAPAPTPASAPESGPVLLGPGDWREVPPGTPHRVRCLGPGQCRVLLVQGVGAYDFVPHAV